MPLPTGQSNAPVYMPQGASSLVVDTGGVLNLTSGQVQFPGNLARGYIPLVAHAIKTTATASGVVAAVGATGIQPNVKTFEVTSGALVYTWSTAAGNANPLMFSPVRIPDDLSTAGPLRVVYTGRTSGAATNDINVRIRAGTATADLGATGALSSTPIERTISVASGSVPASGLLNVEINPTAHATGNVALYSAGISYQRRTS